MNCINKVGLALSTKERLFVKFVICLLLMIHLNISYAAKPIEFFCKYPKLASIDGLENANNFELTFFIDLVSKKAFMKGNNGMTELLVVKNDVEGYALIEITSTGNVMTTAIDKELSSVHSRNSIILSKLVPSQYYGKCTKK